MWILQKKTISCNNGNVSYNFAGCEIDATKFCKSLPTMLNVDDGTLSFYLLTDSSKKPLAGASEVQENTIIVSNLKCNNGYSGRSTNEDYSYICQNGSYTQTQEGTLECDPNGNLPLHITIETVSNNQNFAIDFYKSSTNGSTQDCTIEWGDGATETCPTNYGGSKNHIYAAAGEYELKISGRSFVGINNSYSDSSGQFITKLHSYGKWENNIIRLESAFMGTGLTYINSNAFKYLPNVVNFSNTFNGCHSLTSIPKDLFKYSTKAKDFYYTFGDCSSLTSIPGDLFKNNTEAEAFYFTFFGNRSLVSLPNGLFSNNRKVRTFEGVFYGCHNLASIPNDLFSNNTSVTNFDYTFNECKSLVSIPINLFTNNINVTSFYYVFGITGEPTSRKCVDIDGNNSENTVVNPNWPRWNASGVNMGWAKSGCKVE